MKFQTASVTSKHGRSSNEDWFGFTMIGGIGCWVVADGLGGHHGGEIASRLAVEAIIAAFEANHSITPENISGYLQVAQNAILDRQQAQMELASMRTTVVFLVANHQSAAWAHLGDSRFYHFRRDQIIFQTKDHSVPQALVNAGELAPEDLRFHEDRNRLLRALGEDVELRPAISERAGYPVGRRLSALYRRFLGIHLRRRNATDAGRSGYTCGLAERNGAYTSATGRAEAKQPSR